MGIITPGDIGHIAGGFGKIRMGIQVSPSLKIFTQYLQQAQPPISSLSSLLHSTGGGHLCLQIGMQATAFATWTVARIRQIYLYISVERFFPLKLLASGAHSTS